MRGVCLPQDTWRRRIERDLDVLKEYPRVAVREVRETRSSKVSPSGEVSTEYSVEFDMVLKAAAIIDQEGTLGYEHTLHFKLSRNYPYQMPLVKWKMPIWHPNVSPSGGVCIGALKTENWNESNDLKEVAVAIVNFLQSPNPNHPFNSEAAKWYKENPGALLQAKKEDQRIEAELKRTEPPPNIIILSPKHEPK